MLLSLDRPDEVDERRSFSLVRIKRSEALETVVDDLDGAFPISLLRVDVVDESDSSASSNGKCVDDEDDDAEVYSFAIVLSFSSLKLGIDVELEALPADDNRERL